MPHAKCLVSYLIRSSLVGGALGGIHGYWVAQTLAPRTDPIHPIVSHTATGLFLGPWAPVALPIWMWKYPNPVCPMNPRNWGGGLATPLSADLERIAIHGQE